VTANRNDAPVAANATSDASAGRNLSRRIASACVLAPIGLLTAYIGGWLFVAVCAIGAAVVLWEWTVLVLRSADPRVLVPGAIALLTATLLGGESEAGAAFGVIATGAVLAAGILAALPRRFPASNPVLWAAGAVIYAGVGLLGPVLLRGDPRLGFAALLFLFATVWITDIFAYLAGRAIGGPLLWPDVSPNKTWAGAIGGLAGGVAAGTLVAYASAGTNPPVAAILALVLSIAGQAGDLFESAVKRRFGVKDASNLIPGHGGVMDRFDGFLFAALAALLIGMVRAGMAAPARGLLVW
jgi:phosphatidate cytidylyltransferase